SDVRHRRLRRRAGSAHSYRTTRGRRRTRTDRVTGGYLELVGRPVGQRADDLGGLRPAEHVWRLGDAALDRRHDVAVDRGAAVARRRLPRHGRLPVAGHGVNRARRTGDGRTAAATTPTTTAAALAADALVIEVVVHEPWARGDGS